ncbi:MAG: hypothetical protein D6824_08285 [Planctomycetota bacterium]|nr:MAG: hypothetical protein D6824_08285 [Planctomycetota bacterium]
MTVLVDAYNVLHVTGVLPPALAGPSVEDLARYIAASRWARREVILICDGGPQERSTSHRPVQGVEIRYAGAGKDADSLIIALIRAHSAPRRLLVVSSDQAIVRVARRRRAHTLSSAAFLEKLADDLRTPAKPAGPAKPRAPLTPPAVDAWLDDLGLSGDPILAIAPSAEPRAGMPEQEQRPPTPSPCAEEAGASAPVDPLLLQALQEWPDQLRLSDLDMARWLPDADTPPETLRPASEDDFPPSPRRPRKRRRGRR